MDYRTLRNAGGRAQAFIAAAVPPGHPAEKGTKEDTRKRYSVTAPLRDATPFRMSS